ncbi:hypothetical protein C426_1746 [Lactococcus garvieae DCC43]|uniref:DUF6273 domain-containing protein n=2 Tax=Lactococcus garvieae TaxID=1363 RepID=K2PTJ7_9LACT|nr:hypothetical protein C426_1746 [Lactococcus garvieae DCC43]
MPNATNINDRLNTDPSNAFDRYARLTFGWSREGRDAPWYMPTFNHDNLNPDVQAIVQPVSIPTEVPGITYAQAAPWEGTRWLPAQWNDARFAEVRADRTRVTASGGTLQAFALSFADVVHLSTEEGPFPYLAARVAARNSWWWLRTPGSSEHAWFVGATGAWTGQLHRHNILTEGYRYGGVRPALIINQPAN